MIWSFCIFATSFTLKIVIIQNKTVNELKFQGSLFSFKYDFSLLQLLSYLCSYDRHSCQL